MYYKGTYNGQLKEYARKIFLENMQRQLALKRKFIEMIEPQTFWKKNNGGKRKQVTINNKQKKLDALARMKKTLPKASSNVVGIKDTVFSVFQDMLESFESNFDSTTRKIKKNSTRHLEAVKKRKSK